MNFQKLVTEVHQGRNVNLILDVTKEHVALALRDDEGNQLCATQQTSLSMSGSVWRTVDDLAEYMTDSLVREVLRDEKGIRTPLK